MNTDTPPELTLRTAHAGDVAKEEAGSAIKDDAARGSVRRMRMRIGIVLLVGVAAGVLAAAVGAQTRPPPQPLRVMIISHLRIADLSRLERRGAVGLLVPGVGPTVNRREALAA